MSESLAEKPPCSADLCVFFWRWRDADFLSAPWFAHSCIGRSRERERERGLLGVPRLSRLLRLSRVQVWPAFHSPLLRGEGAEWSPKHERKGGIIKGIKRKLLDVKRVRY